MATPKTKTKAATPKTAAPKAAAPKRKPTKSKTTRARPAFKFKRPTREQIDAENKRREDKRIDETVQYIERMFDRLFGRLDTTRAVEQLGGILRDIYTAAGLMLPGAPGLAIAPGEIHVYDHERRSLGPCCGPVQTHAKMSQDSEEEIAAVGREIAAVVCAVNFGITAHNFGANDEYRAAIIEQQAKSAPDFIDLGVLVPVSALDASVVSCVRNGMMLNDHQAFLLRLGAQAWAIGEAWKRHDAAKPAEPESRFTCPFCGGHEFGTVKSKTPGLSDTGVCHGYKKNPEGGAALPCRFRWPRNEQHDRTYGLRPPARGAGGVGQTFQANPPREGEGTRSEPKVDPAWRDKQQDPPGDRDETDRADEQAREGGESEGT